jgi:hypothetical protein
MRPGQTLPRSRVSRYLGPYGSLALCAAIYSGCTDRSIEIEAYAPCTESEECAREATCANSGVVSVCRPGCEEDSDCPRVDQASASCGLDGHATGQCVIPARDGCPDGMLVASVAADPTAPLICVWEES